MSIFDSRLCLVLQLSIDFVIFVTSAVDWALPFNVDRLLSPLSFLSSVWLIIPCFSTVETVLSFFVALVVDYAMFFHCRKAFVSFAFDYSNYVLFSAFVRPLYLFCFYHFCQPFGRLCLIFATVRFSLYHLCPSVVHYALRINRGKTFVTFVTFVIFVTLVVDYTLFFNGRKTCVIFITPGLDFALIVERLLPHMSFGYPHGRLSFLFLSKYFCNFCRFCHCCRRDYIGVQRLKDYFNPCGQLC